MIFVDTSAFLALLDMGDVNHERATQQWDEFLEQRQDFATNNYVVWESIAIAQKRLGLLAVQDLNEHVLEQILTDWIDKDQHTRA